KQWQLLHDFAPTVRRAPHLFTNEGGAVFGDRRTVEMNNWFEERMKAFAAAVGIETFPLGVASLGEVDAKFAELARDGAAGVLVVNEGLLGSPEWRPNVMEMALRHRLPTSCAQWRDWAVSGCLVTYAEDWDIVVQGMAAKLIKVLRGVAPGDI